MTNNEFRKQFTGYYYVVSWIPENDKPVSVENVITVYKNYTEELRKEKNALYEERNMYKEALNGSKAIIKALEYDLQRANNQINAMNDHN